MGVSMRDFRNLEIWKKSHKAVLLLYKVTQEFPAEEKYGLTNQIRRAGVSIPSNIAEGCGHESDKEFARYLQIAAASSSELQYQLILAYDLKYLNDELYAELSSSVEELKKMIYVFTKRIRAGSI
jgi:four helix bundle protein